MFFKAYGLANMAEVVVNNKMLLVIYLSLFLFTVFLMTDWESKQLSLKTTTSEHADLPQKQLAMVNWPKLSEAGMMKQARHQAILDIEYLQRLYALATDLLGLSDAASIARGTAIYHEIFSQDLKASFFGPGIETIQKTGIDGWLELVTTSLGPMGPTQHLIGTQVVDLDEIEIDDSGNVVKGEALLRSYLQAWHTLPDQKVWLALGTYHSKVRFSDGRWQIWQMDLELTIDETRQMNQ